MKYCGDYYFEDEDDAGRLLDVPIEMRVCGTRRDKQESAPDEAAAADKDELDQA